MLRMCSSISSLRSMKDKGTVPFTHVRRTAMNLPVYFELVRKISDTEGEVLLQGRSFQDEVFDQIPKDQLTDENTFLFVSTLH